ncbi:hypothetical protein UK15_07865 [Streptomyces variegatus]|uniref:Uncharacterized protein n=1 Tax=Streptomyces variegatus TaxID=284040 RepID=A0A0M2GVT2_9ACTN|nr:MULTISPECIES: hypothetical protein [Streptomyces]KJK40255.1 hypothetical protein UK15_07865 [Streptomyces variegatus]
MTGPEHYRAAERLLSEASFESITGNPVTRDGHPRTPEAKAALIAQAHVHAQLAAVAARVSVQPLAGDPDSRGFGEEDWDEWQEAFHSTRKPSTTDKEN